MSRPPLVLESWGKIKRGKTVAGTDIASAKYRDSDGHTRRMSKTGTSPHNAEQNLIRELKKRLSPSEGLSGGTRVSELAEEWWTEWEDAKERPINTVRRYRSVLDNHIIESLGGLTISEATVSRLDRFLKAKTKNGGYSTASIAKVILIGMFGMAARHGAITMGNPVLATAPIPRPVREPKAWTLDEIGSIRSRLRDWDAAKDASGRARVSDLADPCDFMLGTGCRPGEVFALKWDDIDFTAEQPTARIHGTVVRSTTYGLMIQKHTKGKNVRVLTLPGFVVRMLLERRLNSISDLVFPSSTGTVRGPDNFRVQWHDALGDTAFLTAVPKTFRSSVATLVSQIDGADAAKGQLGHSSVTITEKFYIKGHEVARDLTSTLDALDVFAPGSE